MSKYTVKASQSDFLIPPPDPVTTVNCSQTSFLKFSYNCSEHTLYFLRYTKAKFYFNFISRTEKIEWLYSFYPFPLISIEVMMHFGNNVAYDSLHLKPRSSDYLPIESCQRRWNFLISFNVTIHMGQSHNTTQNWPFTIHHWHEVCPLEISNSLHHFRHTISPL